jgi:hypothetical protein
VRNISGRTIDGTRDLETVVATRLGDPGPGIVVVAHRDAAAPSSQAELSGTAALLELARIFAGRQTKRTLTLVSTSGGSGGLAGASDLAQNMPDGDRQPDAVIVLGDMASTRTRQPWVAPWSDAARLAPVRLRRTAEAGLPPAPGRVRPGALGVDQFARQAFPFALGEEAPFNAAGIPAVTISATGDRGPAAGAAVSADRMRGFGRAALRTIDALDNNALLSDVPNGDVVVLNKLLPAWVVRLLVGVLLLPMLVAAVDGLARVRRRKAPVAIWLRWLLGLGFPFVLAVVVARLMGVTGLLGEAPGAAVKAGLIGTDGVALAVVVLVFVLGALAIKPLHRLLAARADWPAAAATEGGGAAALTITMTLLAAVVWIFNPFAAAVLVAPAHLWMLASVPEVRLRRAPALLMVLAALLPAGLVLAVYASAVGASIAQLPWSLLMLVAGGEVGLLTLLTLCVLGACALGAFRLALLPAPHESASVGSESVRGPAGYAGPGSLGGTDSGFRGMRR